MATFTSITIITIWLVLIKHHIFRRCIHDKCERHKPNPSFEKCRENKDKFTNNTNRSAIVLRIFMPDNPVDNEQYCYPWSPEELIEDDKYKSVSVSQLYMYNVNIVKP